MRSNERVQFENKVLRSIRTTESMTHTAEELGSSRQKIYTVLNNAKYVLKRTCFLCSRKFSPYAGQLLCPKCAPANARPLHMLRTVLNKNPALCDKFFRKALKDGIKRRLQKTS